MTSATQTDPACPCGSARPFDHCCGPLLEGRQPAPTAEALMRSRYTAYTRGAIDYVIDTHDPERRGELNPAFMTRWSRESDWLGLEIVRTEAGGERDSTGVVEFRAHFRSKADRVPRVLHEVSRFRRQHAEDGEGGGGGAPGRWVYVDGDAAEKVRTTPVVRTAPKVGRNDPCPCGSGRKYKKCCG